MVCVASIHKNQGCLWMIFVLRVPSSGMLHYLALERTNVSEERITSIIRVTRISELGRTLTVTDNQSMQHASVAS
jgi:hypothetical protein